jgi:hypothetical protein
MKQPVHPGLTEVEWQMARRWAPQEWVLLAGLTLLIGMILWF